jgi:RNA recognition motif-containing protein
LFVANLPFSVDDEGLAQIFQGCNLKSAHVVRTHSGRSRGYGFVVFENEDDQLKALQAKNGATVEDVVGTHNSPQGPQKQTRTIAISISSSVVTPDEAQPQAANPPTIPTTQ